MITKIQGEAPFQVLTNNFSISPSQEGYTLQISADGVNYSNLFSVGANVTRLVTGVAANSYYRLLGNDSEVSINWMKTCVTEGGGGSTYTAGEYISIAEDVISVTGITPDLYLTSADTQDLATQAYVDAAITSATQDFATEADITAATSPIEEHLNDVEYVTATALTELHDAILEISGSTGGSNYIIPAITSLAEYEAISGDVKTGDLIQVYDVDINDDGEDEYGLFEANEIEPGVFLWNRKDNADSLMYSGKSYPWLEEISVYPYDIGTGSYFITPTEGEDFIGIGFTESVDGFEDGTPTIARFTPIFDEQTGQFTGITREDTPIGPDEAKEQVIAAALVDLDERKVESSDVHTIVKLSQAEYDLITPDPDTLYIIINNR